MEVNLIVLTATKKDIIVWNAALKALEKLFKSARIITSVPDDDFHLFTQVRNGAPEVVKDSTILDPRLVSQISLKSGDRSGWYVQQFLKLEMLWKFLPKDSIGMIWDADTVPYSEFEVFDREGRILYATTNECHLVYFEQIYRLLGLDRHIPESFIAQYFVVKREWLESLFSSISIRDTWWEKIIESIDFSEVSGFSEYELLGNYCLKNFPDQLSKNVNISLERYGNSCLGGLTRDSNFWIKLLRKKIDYVSYESWDPIQPLSKVLIRAIFKRCSKSPLGEWSINLGKRLFSQKPGKKIEQFISEYLHGPGLKRVIQVGSNDGIQNDFLRSFIESPRLHVSWILIEPIAFYCDGLRAMYAGRVDVEIVQSFIGNPGLEQVIYFIDPMVAAKMNGKGPANDWAHGQGSFSRAKIVHSIYQNSFRGSLYRNSIHEYISGIMQEIIVSRDISEFLTENTSQLMVIDVQGAELDVIKNITSANRPNYIIIEDEFSDKRIQRTLTQMGYELILGGHDSIYGLVQG